MSTYSPSLRIQLITTGDQAGTWGSTTNTNLGTLIEAGIAGYISVSVIAASQALTALDGAADQSRNAVIALTTTTGAAFNVYAPPAEKTYVIYNASAYAATVYNSTVLGNTTAAGAGVVIPAGKTMTIWSDGTNFALQNTHLIGTVVGNVTGNLTGNVTGNLTGDVTGSLNGNLTAAAPTAATATFGTNTTQVATTAFVQAALQAVYPVGSLYTNAYSSANPSASLGFGTWAAFAAGRVMVGLDPSDPSFSTLGGTSGSKDAVVVSHTHTGTTSTAAAHQHLSPDGQQFITTTPGGIYGGGGASLYPSGSNLTQAAGAHNHTFTTDAAGSSGTNANLQPYINVAMWVRTA